MKQIIVGMRCKIDLLVCNAGVLDSYGGLDDPERNSRAIETVLMTNVAGVYFGAPFLPHLMMAAETGNQTNNHKNARQNDWADSNHFIDHGKPDIECSECAVYCASKACNYP